MPIHAFLLLAAAALANAPSVVDAPVVKAGDTWLFNDIREIGASGFQTAPIELRVERVEVDDRLVGVKTPGSPANYQDHLMSLDWSPLRLDKGAPMRTARPLNFPMTEKKTWIADYENADHVGRRTFARFHAEYHVVGWVAVSTPAGAFQAIRVEGHTQVDAKLEPVVGAVGGVVSGPQGATTFTRTEKAGETEVHHVIMSTFDYVPEVKAVVRSVEEEFDASGVRTSRNTRELVHFTPAT